MVDAPRTGTLRSIAQPEHLVAEEKERVVGSLADHVHAELLNKEASSLRAVLDANIDMVEAHEPEVPWSGLRRHGPPTDLPRYIGSVGAGSGVAPSKGVVRKFG